MLLAAGGQRKVWLIWPIRVTHIWTITEVFLTDSTIMPWVFFSPKCYSLNPRVYQLPNYAIKIASRQLTTHIQTGEKQIQIPHKITFFPFFPFDEKSYTWLGSRGPSSIFQTFWKIILLNRWVRFFIHKLWISHNEGFKNIYKDTAH